MIPFSIIVGMMIPLFYYNREDILFYYQLSQDGEEDIIQEPVTQKLSLYTASFTITPDPGGTEFQDDYDNNTHHLTRRQQTRYSEHR